MSIGSLAFITAIMLAVAVIATLLIINTKYSGKYNANQESLDALAAEDLLEVVVGVPLNEILIAGDNVEIVVRTNSHPIASNSYIAEDLSGKVKLTTNS